MEPTHQPSAAPLRSRTRDSSPSPAVHVARTLDDVLTSWELVYRAYTRSELIAPNPQQIHTVPQAVSPNATVVCGQSDGEIVSTLTIIHDSPRGLPLESVYGNEIAELRARGKRLMEISLLADRREQLTRSLHAVLDMMRFVYYRSQFTHFDDIICGIHPHHAAFYRKYYNFEQVGEETVYPTVRNHPVVLLHLDLPAKLKLDPLPKGLAMHKAQPLEPEAFEDRFVFDETSAAHGRLAAFLAGKSGSTGNVGQDADAGRNVAA